MPSSIADRFTGPDGRRRLVESIRTQRIVGNSEEIAEKIVSAGTIEIFSSGQEFIEQNDSTNDIYFLVAGDREKSGAEEGDDVILVYYGPAKRSCRNLPAPHPAPPDQPAYMAASARAQRQQHRHVARPAPDRIRLERLSPPPFRDSWQGVWREPDGLHHVHDRRQERASFSVWFPRQ